MIGWNVKSWTMTAMLVAVLAVTPWARGNSVIYEGFDYPVPSPADLAGSDGGQGAWLGAWIGAGGGNWGLDLAETGLTYVDGNGEELVTVGNKIEDPNNSGYRSYRQFDTTGLTDPGDVLWFSALVQNTGTSSDLRLKFFANEDDTNPGIGLKINGDGTVEGVAHKNWNDQEAGLGSFDTAGQVTFIVGKMIFDDPDSGGKDVVMLWANPDLDTEPAPGDAFASVSEGGSGLGYGGSYVTVDGGSGFTGFVDEIRLATTYGEVVPVPEPATIGLMSLGLLALRRRR
jgi:hypothetical protein